MLIFIGALAKLQQWQKCMPNKVMRGIVTSINAGDGCAKPVGGLIPAPERLVHSVPDILFKVTIPPDKFFKHTFLNLRNCTSLIVYSI